MATRASWAVFVFSIAFSLPLQAATEFHFDFGPPDSPVAKGFTGLGAGAAYTKAAGYGWSGPAPENYTAPKPAHDPSGYFSLSPLFFYDEVANDLRRDGVESAKPFAFKIDLPRGRYRVVLTAGHLNQARYGMDVYANGKLAAKKLDARHWLSSERGRLDRASGYYRRAKFSVEVADNGLTLEFKGDDAEYQRLFAIDKAKGPDERPHQSTEDPRTLPPENAPWSDIGGPFTKVSLMGLEIYPDEPLPISLDPDSLKISLQGPAPDDDAQEAVDAFNTGQFSKAEQGFLALSDPLVRGLGLLALAGRPDYENEYPNTEAAVAALKEAAAAPKANACVREALETAEIFRNGLIQYRDRGIPPKNGPRSTWRALSEFNQSEPQDLSYYKSLLYQGRLLMTLDPHMWAWQGETGKQKLRLVEKKFPQNRFVRYRFHNEWKPFGDGSRDSDWVMKDYESKVKDSPEWVKAIYPAFQDLTDWAVWWIRFRQQSDGSIGGGWGDDVELVGAFGYVGYVSRDLPPELVKGSGLLVNGVWTTSEVDPEMGYCLPLADAEHTAEWTGNTLGMMILIDYGNPAWIERSMETAKLMRDLWTDFDKNGQRRFRANFFGAAQVGSGDQCNDSWINYRAIRPAQAVWWYNQSPAIAKLNSELGDAWLASSLSTEGGKPKGVIPAQVAFPDATLGGVHSPNWWSCIEPHGTVNYDWPSQTYKDYIQDLLATASRATGDAKYLEPFRLEYELALRHGQTPPLKTGGNLQSVPDPRNPSAAKKDAPAASKPGASSAQPGSEQWVGEQLKGVNRWLIEKNRLEGRKGPLENNLTKEEVVVAGLYTHDMFQKSWPLRTSESGPTDRVAFVGLVNPFLVYTGGRIGGPLLEADVTYENTTRDFAAAVLGSDPQGLRILYHSLADAERKIGIVPWHLEAGGRYRLRYGPDADENEKMDTVTEDREFDFPQIGTPLYVSVKPRLTYIIEVEQIKRGRGAELAPDPGLGAGDIRYDSGQILARIHNVGSKAVRHVEVAAYDGDPKHGGIEVGKAMIPNIEAPLDLDPKTTTIGFPWAPKDDKPHEIYIVIDPENKLDNEITNFNNTAHAALPAKDAEKKAD